MAGSDFEGVYVSTNCPSVHQVLTQYLCLNYTEEVFILCSLFAQQFSFCGSHGLLSGSGFEGFTV